MVSPLYFANYRRASPDAQPVGLAREFECPYTLNMRMPYFKVILPLLFSGMLTCSACTAPPQGPATQAVPAAGTENADVLSVGVTGESGAYQFAVQVASPDSGCERYADWWELVTEDGQLLYRRILLHSHVDEQPFTRSGGPVAVEPDTVLWVRAHLHPDGYGGSTLRGTPRSGFEPVSIPAGMFSELENIAPQPEDCAF